MKPLRTGTSPHNLPTQRSKVVLKRLSGGVLFCCGLFSGVGVMVVCCLHTCQISFQQCRTRHYLLLSPACQLGGGGGLGACRLRMTSPRKCCLEHKISRKGEYRCSCSEQFRGIVVQQLSKCQPSSTGTKNPYSPQAVARAEHGM